MSRYGKNIRLRRILRCGRGSLVVAFDHGLVLGPIPGTDNPTRQISRFIEGKADALLLNLGMFGLLAEVPAQESRLGFIARLDWTTAMGTASTIPPGTFRSCLVAQPEEALQAGADAVIAFLIIGSGDAEFERSEIQRVASVSRECERLGIPLIVESVARGPGIQNPRDPQWLMLHTRIAAELGADVIKTEYSGDPDSMRTVVTACPIPILVLGGSRATSDRDIVNIVHDVMQAGAAGVFFGRNVFQAEHIPELLQRIHVELKASALVVGSKS
jgi:DhnA family fructose-bisphosphate aldolase class Ia